MRISKRTRCFYQGIKYGRLWCGVVQNVWWRLAGWYRNLWILTKLSEIWWYRISDKLWFANWQDHSWWVDVMQTFLIHFMPVGFLISWTKKVRIATTTYDMSFRRNCQQSSGVPLCPQKGPNLILAKSSSLVSWVIFLKTLLGKVLLTFGEMPKFCTDLSQTKRPNIPQTWA